MNRKTHDYASGVASLDGRMTNIENNYATKSDVAELRADMHKMHIDTTRWMIATVISLFLGFAGLFFVMNNTSRASGPQLPIIIQMPSGSGPVVPGPQRPHEPGQGAGR